MEKLIFHNNDRILAAYEEPIDYSVLSIGVQTLALILFVEVVRYRLDSAAKGRPFFKTVLDGIYSELSTLGIVELVVYLILKYFENVDKAKKTVFADVHFALFYTAIFNAFQSVFVAWATWRTSNSLWVQTEFLDLDHYVEIREEFDRIKAIFGAEDDYEFVYGGGNFKGVLKYFFQSVRNPGLRGRYMNLLVQVRFHQLRLHFLEGNDLPLTLKVNEYLKRSEERVLIKLVHVSASAWLMLTGGLNMIYFLMGIVSYTTEDQKIVGFSMTGIFFFMMFVFIFICLVLYFKMRSIFRTIITMKYNTNKSDIEGHNAGMKNQLSLFWLGEPQFVISIIQFMQFGYALALAVVLMYWSTLTGPVQPYWYLVSVATCYLIFVFVLSKVLPQYTLCTSLGYLVNQKNLMETVAVHRLEEARRIQLRRKASVYFDNDDDSVIYFEETNNNSDMHTSLQKDSSDSIITGSPPGLVIDSSRSTSDRTQILAELVKSDTSSLRNLLPEDSREKIRKRELRRNRRQKSVSDGVALMRAFGSAISEVTVPTITSLTTPLSRSFDDDDIVKRDREARAERRKNRKKTMSDGVALMRALGSAVTSPIGLSQTSQKALDDNDILKKRTNRGENRKKTLSASAVIQSWQNVTNKEIDSVESYHLDSESSKVIQKDPTNISRNLLTNPTPLSSEFLKTRMQQRAERIGRRKSRSESAVIQNWHEHTMTATRESGLVEPIKIPAQLDPSIIKDWNASGKSQVKTNENEFLPTIGRLKPYLDLSTLDRQPSSTPALDRATFSPKNIQFQGQTKPTIAPSESNVQDDPQEDDEDGSTVNTETSVGALSDVDDPDWEASNFVGLSTASISWSADLSPGEMFAGAKTFFLSTRYHTISHFFGTFVVFFLVGHRVEVMLATTGAIKASESTWELDLNISFWMEAAWYAFFIAIGMLELLLFLPIRDESLEHHALIISAILDIFISGACLALLFLAEAQRCCDGGERDVVDCCPFWGSRTYGGLGDIEPLTSLIGLRIFRFMLGSFFVNYFDKGSELGMQAVNSRNESFEKYDEGEEDSKKRKMDKSMQTEVGTPLELWEKAINKYPDIVEKYGQFSGELFQVMLGLEIVTEPQPKTVDPITPYTSEITAGFSLSPDSGKEDIKSEGMQIKLSGKQYSELSVQAQSIILAGKLGKPVKSMGNLMDLGSNLPALLEETDNDLLDSPQPRKKLAITAFKIDAAKLALEENLHSNFIAPNARLVRSMRRCDRKMLPLLNEWACVDIVFTQFELVYFEALSFKDPSETTHQESSSLLALQATNGGKGLRLQDVAYGRKVVGHFNLSDVTEIHVERSMPLSNSSPIKECALLYDGDIESGSEFWAKSSKASVVSACEKLCGQQLSRNLRWAKVKEDRLKLVTLHGTLILRYYSDLDNIESHLEESAKESELKGPLRKNIAFQWAQTITHHCGTSHLRQPLPHFGENNSDELRDLLEVSQYHEKELEEALKAMKTYVNSNQVNKAANSLPRSVSFRRLHLLNSDEKDLKEKVHRRLSSWAKTPVKKEEGALKDDDDSGVEVVLRSGKSDEEGEVFF
jgi:hypothetical protein